MIDISWGETFVLVGISATVIGRKDLPKASRAIGKQIGRIVGLLQGARLRADRFTVDNELSSLQSELRSGLRELDTVKGELAVAASSRGFVGRGLGGRSRVGNGLGNSAGGAVVGRQGIDSTPVISGSDYLTAARTAESSTSSSQPSYVTPSPSLSQLAPRSQSVAAVAEEQWEKQGIGFTSRAEMGTGSVGVGMGGGLADREKGGSSLLADLLQQNLIHDQYDRAVIEQDQALAARMERIKREVNEGDGGKSKKED